MPAILVTKEGLRRSGFEALDQSNPEEWWSNCPPVVQIEIGEDYVRYCFDFDSRGRFLGYHRDDYYEYGKEAVEIARRLYLDGLEEMPRCPSCGRRIDFLKCYKTDQVEEWNLSVEVEYDVAVPNWEYVDLVEDDTERYHCPYCGALLFTDKVDAIRFLSS